MPMRRVAAWIVAVVGCAVAGIGALIAGFQRPARGLLSVVLEVGSLLAVSLLGLLLVQARRSAKRRAVYLVTEGVPAVGTVIDVRDAGRSANSWRVWFRLRIEPIDGSPAFAVEKTVIAPRFGPRPGRRFPVWYDPADPTRFVLSHEFYPGTPPLVSGLFAVAAQGGLGKGDPLAGLDQLRRDGVLSDAEGEALAERIRARKQSDQDTADRP